MKINLLRGLMHSILRLLCCRAKQSHVWGWLDPSANADLMPVTYLKGAGVAIGRGAEAFQAQQGEQAADAAAAAAQSGR